MATSLIGAGLAAGAVGMWMLSTVPGSNDPDAHAAAATTASFVVAGNGPVNEISPPTASVGMGVVQLVSQLSPSLVGLVVKKGRESSLVTAVAIADGRLVLTSASAIVGATSFGAIMPSGSSVPASLIASDPHAGVAVLRVAGEETGVPRISDDALSPGDLAIAVHLVEAQRPEHAKGRSGSPGPRSSGTGFVTIAELAVGTVRAVGVNGSAAGQQDGLLDAIEVDAPLAGDSGGAVLLDARGYVEGILDGQAGTGDGRVDLFAPAQLAVTAGRLLANGQGGAHGWLGIRGADASGGGAGVEQVLPGSAAALAGLRPGDTILEVDGKPIRTIAELQAALYVLQPGAPVSFRVSRGARTFSVDASLGRSPS